MLGFVYMSPPLNSFLLYCKDHRDIVKEANPGKHNSEISSILGKQWRGMSLDEKKKYKDLAKFRRKVSSILYFNFYILIIFEGILQNKPF